MNCLNVNRGRFTFVELSPTLKRQSRCKDVPIENAEHKQ